MRTSTFNKDLSDGQQMEITVMEYLHNHPEYLSQLIKWESSSSYGRFSGYDLCAGFKIEVKYDKMSDTTGNFAFEFENSLTHKASGIYSSESDYICYVTEDSYYIFDRLKLIEDIGKNQLKFKTHDNKNIYSGFRTVVKAGDGNASVYLYKIQYIRTFFNSIKFIAPRD